jgi:3-oxoadipate enol-lactonase
MLSLFPPGRIIPVPDRGEMFVRDSGPDSDRQGTLLLLHGWFASADINWAASYGPLIAAGYRVVAVDHRGHGRGIRSPKPFRLIDCADDAAGLVREMNLGPVIPVGYSMGGPIAELLAHRHPELVRGLVLSATPLSWNDRPKQRRRWRLMSVLGFGLRLFSPRVYSGALRRGGFANEDVVSWLMGELMRHDPAAMAEAGREMARYNSRPWIGTLPMPVVVLCTSQDDLVPPPDQRALAAAIPGAELIETGGDHYAVGRHPDYMPNLLRSIGRVVERAGEGAPPTSEAEAV